MSCISMVCAETHIETIPQIKGEHKHSIAYRYILNWLVRKPGAFENYSYQANMFLTGHFRMSYVIMNLHSNIVKLS